MIFRRSIKDNILFPQRYIFNKKLSIKLQKGHKYKEVIKLLRKTLEPPSYYNFNLEYNELKRPILIKPL